VESRAPADGEATPPPRRAPYLGRLREAAARIGTTLDLSRTAGEVVEAAVPGFADAATVFVAERLLAADDVTAPPDGQGMVVRRLAALVAGEPATETYTVLPPGEVVVIGPESAALRAMVSGQPTVSGQLDHDTLERLSRQPGGREAVAGFTSFLAMPLAAHGAVVGSATFGRRAGSPPFGDADIAAAGELLYRAAVSIDNARLYARERRTALALQRGLLPGKLDIPPGLEVARRYLPVGDSVVGGDWHDIVPLPDGRAALIVGDAMGHGPEAAAVMVQLRTAAHILAALDLAPGEILRRLDELAAGLAAPFATCIYAVIDPAASSCLIAQAGHLPPALVLPSGAGRMLDLPPGLPLGLEAGSFESTLVSLPPGATLALFTDGLVETRARSLGDGLATLRDLLCTALADPAVPLSEAGDSVTQALRPHGEDDITLVLARVRGPG
jgi:stage II sporulation SpoE-like protein/GAF domain-containing protein